MPIELSLKDLKHASNFNPVAHLGLATGDKQRLTGVSISEGLGSRWQTQNKIKNNKHNHSKHAANIFQKYSKSKFKL